MVLQNEQWRDLDGRDHKMFVVRSMGAGRGCGILDTYNNTFVLFSDGISREEAKQMLEHRTMEEYDQWRNSLHEAIKQTH